MSVEIIRDFTSRSEIGTNRVGLRPSAGQELGAPPEKPEFSELVTEFARDVNDIQFRAGYAVEQFVTGKAADVHQVMVAVEQPFSKMVKR